MGLLRRRATDDRAYAGDAVTREETERTGPSPGIVRAIATLIGVAAALLLIWIAQALVGDEATTSEYWIALGLIAAGGLALGLSQLLGGWTKWGWPTLSPTVFLLGFLPTLIVGGWIALAKQPQAGLEEGRFDRWSQDIGIGGFVNDMAPYLPAIALVVGLVLAFSFDTTGPRTRRLTREPVVADEDVQDYRTDRTTPVATTTGSGTTVAEDIRQRDTVGARTADERTDVERRST